MANANGVCADPVSMRCVQVCGFVDGDLLLAFLDLTAQEQTKLLQDWPGGGGPSLASVTQLLDTVLQRIL